eukprot:gb/GECH01004226.1/.p1 GENE.gb/GECH01004226.1/~~gb/GECH01004226.1/.p1  ORF type:complete len:1717 (+),score=253.33 gb/GECH01004226.1/:1-5151(+)
MLRASGSKSVLVSSARSSSIFSRSHIQTLHVRNISSLISEQPKELTPFRLSRNFVERFAEEKPPFGFNGLGEIVYKRTYSRLKEEGRNEEWYETVERVVNGCYNLQKRWIEEHRLGWNAWKAQKSAQEMYRRIFWMKFLPPGRGLWAMGSPLTEERGLYAALNNCFSGETELITQDGIKRFIDTVDTTQTVLSENGKWIDAPIRSFGEQPLRKITIHRQGFKRVIHATGDHIWFIQDRCSDNHRWQECPTDKLEPGTYLQPSFSSGIQDSARPSPEGIAHGMVFGGGNIAIDSDNTHLYWGGGDPHRERGSGIPLSLQLHDEVRNAIHAAHMSRQYKELPDITKNKSYLYGFLSGYIAVHGCVATDGEIRILSHSHETISFVRDAAAVLGLGHYGVQEGTVDGNTTRSGAHHTFSITLMRDTLPEELFLIKEHRDQCAKDAEHHPWCVAGVEETDRVEEVYCAVVPDTNSFTLAEGILTHNCGFVSTADMKTEPAKPFCFLMDAAMLGVGVGFDTKGEGSIVVKHPRRKNTADDVFVVPDSREGWVQSVKILLDAFFHGTSSPEDASATSPSSSLPTLPQFDYSQIRSAGEPIRGFGGRAAGAEPLQQLHHALFDILSQQVGNHISVTTITDIMNMIGRCIVSGNIRNTAEIAFGSPHNQEFLDLKNYKKNPHRASYGWTSNNSVFAELGMDYSAATERIIDNGEPGFAWLDNMRNYGRMNGIEDRRDSRAAGGNPCLPGDTIVMTDRGPRRIKDLIHKPFNAVVNGEVYPSHGGFWKTGVNDVYAIQTKEGHSIRLTANHKVLVTGIVEGDRYYIWKRADELIWGDLIVLNHPGTPEQLRWSGEGSFIEGERAGRNIDLSCSLDQFYHRITCRNDNDSIISSDMDPEEYQSYFMTATSSDFQRGFLSAIFDNYGDVSEGSTRNKHRSSISMTSTHQDTLNMLQKILILHGINSTVEQLPAPFDSGDIGLTAQSRGIDPNSSASFTLWQLSIVTGNNHMLFEKLIGFQNVTKQQQQVLDNMDTVHYQGLQQQQQIPEQDYTSFNDEQNGVQSLCVATFECLTHTDTSISVYDCTVEEAHRFIADGVVVHNCLEQTLESYELCCVSADTRILTRDGYPRIADAVGAPVQVWNGAEWSSVVPFVAARNKDLYRVTVSDGSYIDVTDNHKWSVRTADHLAVGYRSVETRDLNVGMSLETTRVTTSDRGEHSDIAYPSGWQIGISAINSRDKPKTRGLRSNQDDGVEHNDPNRRNHMDSFKMFPPFQSHPSWISTLTDPSCGLPDPVFSWDASSIREFVLGWRAAQDTPHSGDRKPEHCTLLGSETQIRDTQLLLRKTGINGAYIYRMQDVHPYCWGLTIPEYDMLRLHAGVETMPYLSSEKDLNRNDNNNNGIEIQRVINIEKLDGKHTVYCFTEPRRHMGVFGNCLTYQCLVETFPFNHESLDDFQRTLKYAYLYAKTVTLGKTHWPETNRVLLRNRRIGCSLSGVAQFISEKGIHPMKEWCESGYDTIQKYDRLYSEWFAIPRSIKTTSIKPSGTVSLLSGSTPGMHYPESRFYIRRMRLSRGSDLVQPLRDANYRIEPAADDPDNTVVVEFPIDMGRNMRTLEDVSMWEQLSLASFLQRYWADNQVSVTVSFDPEREGPHISHALDYFQYQLKGVSLLPRLELGAYAQMPYEAVTEERYRRDVSRLQPLDVRHTRRKDADVEADKFCDSDRCFTTI